MSLFSTSAQPSGPTSPPPLPPVSSPSLTLPGSSASNAKGSGLRLPLYSEDKEPEVGEPVFFENFSRGLLKTKMTEYKAGKYTKRYLVAYLEFMHLSGYVSNLEYLEYKEELSHEAA